jgi:signal peptidase I
MAPQRGDIVAVWTGKDLLIKRVVGVPGDYLSAYNGTFHVNGIALAEKYVEFHGFWNVEPARIGANEFVVSGDNRTETLVAVVNAKRIVGKINQ